MTACSTLRYTSLLAVWLCCVFNSVSAQESESSGGDGASFLDMSFEELFDIPVFSRPLLGIHHVHPAGEWMLAYNDRHMDMHGLQDGSQHVDEADLFAQGYTVAPHEMHVHMHMFEAMYGITDDVSVMFMLPYANKRMNHETASGGDFETESHGIGDVSATAIVSIYDSQPHLVHLSAGLYLPTGSIDERAATPMGPQQKLPYPMQLGSGSYAPQVGLTYLYSGEHWSLGAFLSHRTYVGRNDAGYRLGDYSKADFWLVGQWNEWITTSLRAHGQVTRNIHGFDAELNPMMAPTADPNLRGMRRIDIAAGASLRLPFKPFSNFRLVAEYAEPVYQHLDGPQLAMESRWGFGVQWIF